MLTVVIVMTAHHMLSGTLLKSLANSSFSKKYTNEANTTITKAMIINNRQSSLELACSVFTRTWRTYDSLKI